MVVRWVHEDLALVSGGVSSKPTHGYLYTASIVVALDNFITKVADGAEIGNYAVSDQNRLSQMNPQKIAEWSRQWARPGNISK